MINPNYAYLYEDFLNANKTAGSDLTYLLRSLFSRAASEAYRRSFLSDGDKSSEYRRISYELEELAINIETFIEADGRVSNYHRPVIMEAIIISNRLFFIDKKEMRIQIETSIKYIAVDLRKNRQNELLAA